MTRRRKDPLRPLRHTQRQELNRLRRSWTAPAVQVPRAAALLLVSVGVDYQDAARAVGRKSGAAISHLPADGRVRIEGGTTCPNVVLHPWRQRQLSAVLAGLPDPPPTAKASRAAWERWQAGLAAKPTLPSALPPLRMLLVLDNRADRKS